MSIAFTTATPGATGVARAPRTVAVMTRHQSGAGATTPRRIRTEYEVDELATWLRSSERNLPVVVVTTHFDKPVTRIDADKLAADLASLAEVVILETGPHSERLAEIVGPMWGVYGSGARIYPTETHWHYNPFLAPIFIRRPGQNGAKQTEEIVRRVRNHDYGSTSTRPVHEWDGPSMTGAARKAVDLDQARRERAERSGPALTHSLAGALDPLAAEVLRTIAEKAETAKQAPSESQEAVATPPVAVAPAPVAALVPAVPPAEPQAAPLFRGDPDRALGLKDPFDALREIVRDLQSDAGAAITRAERAEAELRDVDRERAGERIKTARLETQLAAARAKARQPAVSPNAGSAEIASANRENVALSQQNQELRVKLAEAVEKARVAGAAARKATKGQRTGPADSLIELEVEKFPTPEDAARHAILLAWIERVPATEKLKHPLPQYGISARFVPSLTSLTVGQLGKALRCTVDMLTGLGDDMFARQLHPLRTSVAGNAGFHVRDDGAICMRAYIESNSANARRLHFWKCQDGSIELIRIVSHDDMHP